MKKFIFYCNDINFDNSLNFLKYLKDCNSTNINSINILNFSLYFSISNKKIKLMKKLLELGADPNNTDHKDRLPLNLTTPYDTHLTKYLIEHGADITKCKDIGLINAIENDFKKVKVFS